jgi:hypothetical protein
LLLALATTLCYDRYILCRDYLFKYTDEDQAIMWDAAHELLHGRIREPCFYGQDYNSCVEGFLAAPLIAAGVRYHIAVPLVTVTLSLLPFLVLAFVAWRRGQSLVAGACLLLPVLLPARYGLMTGMPRGFVTGVAFAIFPAVLLLPPPLRPRRAHADGETPRLRPTGRPTWLRRSWPAARYFLAAALALVSIQLNPNCLVLLVPVAVYAFLTSWREWKFWVFGTAGLLAAAPYLLYVYQFYYVYNDDYRVYLRGKVYDWSFANYYSYLWQAVAPPNGNSVVLADLVPIHITAAQAPLFMAAAFAAVTLLLIFRLRAAAVAAAFTGVLFTLISFAFSRVNDNRGVNPVTFPYARMYLGLPVLFVWLLFLVNHRPWPRLSNVPATRWLARGALVGCLLAGITAVREKAAGLPALIAYEIRNAYICRPIPVYELYAVAREVRKAVAAENVSVLATPNKQYAYALPALTDCDTVYTSPQERRTWRLLDEAGHKTDKLLLIGISGGTQVAGGRQVTVDDDGDEVPTEAAPPPTAAAPRPTPPPAPSPAQNRGGRGRGGNAEAPPAGARGGRGAGRSAALTTPPDASGNYTLFVEPVTVAKTNGRTVLDTLRALGTSVPRITTPSPSPDDPTPRPVVQRSNWPR